MIFDYLEKTNGKFIIPRVVFDEIVHIHRKELESRSNKIQNAIRHFNLATPDQSHTLSVPKFDLTNQSLLFIQHLKKTLKLKDDQIIPSKNEYLPVVLDRAIKNIKPFRGHDQGFRDTVIWLTLKDYCSPGSEKQIVFLTVLEDFEYIVTADFEFIAGIQFDWYDDHPFNAWGYTGGTEKVVFKFSSEISFRVKQKEMVNIAFTHLSAGRALY